MAAPRSLLAVPGLAATDPLFRQELVLMAERHGWDADAIATVMSLESGFRASIKNPLPGQTASGLIQFTDATARGLGVAGGAAEIRAMSAVEQLPIVERFYTRALGTRTNRPVDFYLAGWGSGIGNPESFVLARLTDERKFNAGKDNLYSLNSGLDENKNGEITVGDIAERMRAQQAKAGGKRLEVPIMDRPLVPPAAVPGLSWVPLSPELRSQYLAELCASLPVVRLGSSGPLVRVVEFLAEAPGSGVVSVYTENAIRGFQQRLAAKGSYRGRIDGEVGPQTWRAIFEGVKS